MRFSLKPPQIKSEEDFKDFFEQAQYYGVFDYYDDANIAVRVRRGDEITGVIKKPSKAS